ncbi:hypothetical protein Plim_0372 [Planctopirus limnophila DSM 3776]|uniref:DUF4145 domain-containing protein n=1 Tax=Planctopirus limnophila (strain ATCC 43296 / DSM 3776 / IFAM 1008 / Mu 290) TaxID=521674 RepID=D5SPJ3_PLAL2|nr:hypothetical protein [Planctopirus limnophila]ADG66223.1 hypothetical protein Plim_0372 [Planctopirus limnophila DSM 3776]
MLNQPSPDFSLIIKDNEKTAAQALSDGQFVQTYLLVHSLIEALLRHFLQISDEKNISFDKLIQKYRVYLDQMGYTIPTFLDELTQFNRRRNRIVHQLWRKGHSYTNLQAEPAARGAVIMYSLLIEWLETYDPAITQIGFRLDEGI